MRPSAASRVRSPPRPRPATAPARPRKERTDDRAGASLLVWVVELDEGRLHRDGAADLRVPRRGDECRRLPADAGPSGRVRAVPARVPDGPGAEDGDQALLWLRGGPGRAADDHPAPADHGPDRDHRLTRSRGFSAARLSPNRSGAVGIPTAPLLLGRKPRSGVRAPTVVRRVALAAAPLPGPLAHGGLLSGLHSASSVP